MMVCHWLVVLEVNGLTVDWLSRHIYWTDGRRRTVEVADFDGNNRRILITERLSQPRGIYADPTNRFVSASSKSFSIGSLKLDSETPFRDTDSFRFCHLVDSGEYVYRFVARMSKCSEVGNVTFDVLSRLSSILTVRAVCNNRTVKTEKQTQ